MGAPEIVCSGQQYCAVQNLLTQVCDETSNIAEVHLKLGSFSLKVRQEIGKPAPTLASWKMLPMLAFFSSPLLECTCCGALQRRGKTVLHSATSMNCEVSIMKMVRHPSVVRLHEVLASREKIYIVLEFVSGGELFDEIVHQGRLSEERSRKYYQQLIDAVDYCHGEGVSHRDLKPENFLLDAHGSLKFQTLGSVRYLSKDK